MNKIAAALLSVVSLACLGLSAVVVSSLSREPVPDRAGYVLAAWLGLLAVAGGITSWRMRSGWQAIFRVTSGRAFLILGVGFSGWIVNNRLNNDVDGAALSQRLHALNERLDRADRLSEFVRLDFTAAPDTPEISALVDHCKRSMPPERAGNPGYCRCVAVHTAAYVYPVLSPACRGVHGLSLTGGAERCAHEPFPFGLMGKILERCGRWSQRPDGGASLTE